MRTIKFRAWNPQQGKMFTPDLINFHTYKEAALVVRGAGPHFYDCTYAPDENILMQFIGFKDKNGKDIFEDDYVKFTEGDKDIWIFRVIYIESKACFALESPNRFMDFMAANFSSKLTETYSEKFEVVGDIYRSPEINEILNSIK